MAADDPIEVVRRLTEAFNAFDVDAVIALCAPDVEVHENPDFPDASTYRGHDGVRAMLADWRESFASTRTSIDELTADGDTVTLVGTYEGTGAVTGVPVKMHGQVAVYEVRDGKIHSARFTGGVA